MAVETSYDHIPADGATLANLDYVTTGDLYILIDESPVDDKPPSGHNGDERTCQHLECVCDFHATTFLYLQPGFQMRPFHMRNAEDEATFHIE